MGKLLWAGSAFFALLSTTAWAETGVTEQEIVIGQSCALSGPAEALGKGMNIGMNAYFSKINAEGGVQGRQIKLISYDDGYEPEKAMANSKAMIENDHVFLQIGEVGTPTSKAVVPIIEEAKMPFFGPFTGAEFLRNPHKRYVVNVRGSYNQEMERLAHYLVDEKGLKNIAVFYQNDGYGQAGLSGIKKALESRNMVLCAEGTYERNTVAVKSGLLAIRKAKPEAVVMVGAYKPCAEFIKLAKKSKMTDVVYCNISFVGTEALKAELGEAGEGCIISQVVNFPYDASLPLVAEYTDSMKKYAADEPVGFVSLEGYMVAKLFCMVADKAGKDMTRESFLDTVGQVGTFDMGGVSLNFGPEDHQGMDKVFLTVIKAGKILPL